MNMRALVAAALAVIALGLLLGLVPGSAGTATGTSCGSPWVRNTAMIDAADRGARLGADLIGARAGRDFESTSYKTLCDNALDTRGVLGGVAAGLGVLALLGAALVNANQTAQSRE